MWAGAIHLQKLNYYAKKQAVKKRHITRSNNHTAHPPATRYHTDSGFLRLLPCYSKIVYICTKQVA